MGYEDIISIILKLSPVSLKDFLEVIKKEIIFIIILIIPVLLVYEIYKTKENGIFLIIIGLFGLYTTLILAYIVGNIFDKNIVEATVLNEATKYYLIVFSVFVTLSIIKDVVCNVKNVKNSEK